MSDELKTENQEEAIAVADEQDNSSVEQTPEQEDTNAVAKSKQAKISVEELDTLKQDLAAALKKADEQWELAVRAKAETDNIRKRAERDVENAHKFGVEKLVKELLPVIDGIEQGLATASEADENLKAIREGMVLTLQMLQNVLNKFNVEQIQAEGAAFDPSIHEAMSMLENQEVSPGTILHVVQPGYTLHGRVVRAARVIVAKGAPGESIDEKA